MKRISVIVSLVLFLSLLLSACSKQIDNNRPTLQEEISTIEQAKQIDLTALIWGQDTNSEIEDLATFIENEYNIDLQINLIDDYDLTGSKTSKLLNETEEGGLFFFYFTNLDNLKEMADKGEILSLTEALKNNDTFKALPDEMKQMYSIGDDDIWAISRSYSQNIYGRVYKTEYLEQASVEVPNNLAELYDVTKKLKQLNNESVGLVYYNPLSLNDIFYANEVPLAMSHTGYNITSIVFNDKTQSFEDSMNKENMKETLNYIANLFSDKLITVTGNYRSRGIPTVNSLSGNENYTNAYGLIPTQFFGNPEYEIIYGVTGSTNININPLQYNYTNGYYVLSSKTKDATNVINSFVSIFYGDVKGYVASVYGIPGEVYKFNGDSVNILDNDFFSRSRFPIVGENPLINFSNMDITASNDLIPQLESYSNSINEKNIYIEQGLISSKMIRLSTELAYPLVFPSLDDYALSNPATLLLDEVLQSAFRGFVSADDAIKEYQEKMRQLGQQEVLDKLNEQLGITTSYKY